MRGHEDCIRHVAEGVFGKGICETCNGKGSVLDSIRDQLVDSLCDDCGGYGYIQPDNKYESEFKLLYDGPDYEEAFIKATEAHAQTELARIVCYRKDGSTRVTI